MVNNQGNQTMGGPPPVDDAWWMAVLQDVESQYQSKPTQKKKPETPKEPSITPAPAAESKNPAQDWEWAQALYQEDQVIDLTVTGFNRGGILVDSTRLQGFVPLSHLVQIPRKCQEESEIKRSLEAYIGKTLRLKVIECNPDRGRVVFSERAAQTDPGRRIELLDDLQEGDCTVGNITTLTDFGAFVDLGGIEGLIHISELSWGRVCHPSDVVAVGQQVEVCILQIDRAQSRVALSLKRLLPNPWDTIETIYEPGQCAEAVITSVVPFGAFARLDSGLDGLIHASEFGQNGGDGQRPDDILNEGQRVQVRILHIDSDRQRLGLSLQEIYD